MKKKLTDSIELVDQAATGALQLVEEVVSAARESSEQEMFLEYLDLLHFITPVFQRYKVLARTKGIRVTLNAGADIVMASINRDRFYHHPSPTGRRKITSAPLSVFGT